MKIILRQYVLILFGGGVRLDFFWEKFYPIKMLFGKGKGRKTTCFVKYQIAFFFLAFEFNMPTRLTRADETYSRENSRNRVLEILKKQDKKFSTSSQASSPAINLLWMEDTIELYGFFEFINGSRRGSSFGTKPSLCMPWANKTAID